MNNKNTDLNLATRTALKNSNWFNGLDNKLIAEIANLSKTRSYSAGSTIFQRYEPGDFLYGVISGQIRITTQSPTGREIALNTLGPGDIGGEIAVLDGGPRTATGRAVSKTVVFVVPQNEFRELMLRQPTIAIYLVKILCERVRLSSQRIEGEAFLSVSERVAHHLNRLASADLQRSGATQSAVTIKISQSELAAFLNVSRQVVNRCLQEMQANRYVELGRGKIVVNDLTALLIPDAQLTL